MSRRGRETTRHRRAWGWISRMSRRRRRGGIAGRATGVRGAGTSSRRRGRVRRVHVAGSIFQRPVEALVVHIFCMHLLRCCGTTWKIRQPKIVGAVRKLAGTAGTVIHTEARAAGTPRTKMDMHNAKKPWARRHFGLVAFFGGKENIGRNQAVSRFLIIEGENNAPTRREWRMEHYILAFRMGGSKW